MRRRIISLVCVLVLCLALLTPGQAAGSVCFTAINDNLRPLTSDTMPVWSSGELYVPYTVFDAATTGVSLGTGSIYSRNSGVVSIFSLSQILVFDINEGTCYNQHTGETFSARAIIRNGRAYVPVARVCSFFGLTYSYNFTAYGYLVRICSADAALSDDRFIDAGSDSMSWRLREYNQSLSAGQTEEPAVTTPTEPAISTDPDPTAVTTYLAIRCQTGEAGEKIAQTLEQNGAVGLFFFPAEEIGQQGALIRRLLGSGHSVGILAQGSTAAQTQELLELGSQAFQTVAHSRTYFVLVPEEQRGELTAMGWACWNTGVEAIPDGSLSAYSFAAATVRALPSRGSVYLTLDDSQATSDAMSYLLSRLSSGLYTVTIPRETRL